MIVTEEEGIEELILLETLDRVELVVRGVDFLNAEVCGDSV